MVLRDYTRCRAGGLVDHTAYPNYTRYTIPVPAYDIYSLQAMMKITFNSSG